MHRSSILSPNAQHVVARRYARAIGDGARREAWKEVVQRVVDFVSMQEAPGRRRAAFVQRVARLILDRRFLPNTPCFMNAGTDLPQLASCFVLAIPDSLDGILHALAEVARVQQLGGGTGFTFQEIRPAGAPIGGGRGVASGPLSFLRMFDVMTDVVKQGGLRRGANMGILTVSHPDILNFIHAKDDRSQFANFNLSVSLTDRFMQAAERMEWMQQEFAGRAWSAPIIDPVTGQPYVVWRNARGDLVPAGDACANPTVAEAEKPPRPGMLHAGDVWLRIVRSAHAQGEPGVIFIDEVNRHNRLGNSLGPLHASNPCGEQFLHSHNACNLGSLDVASFLTDDMQVDWLAFRDAIWTSVRFLDNVIDASLWPSDAIANVVRRTRPIGLGIMGFADLCLAVGVRYGTPESIGLLESVLAFLRREAWSASLQLGASKGVFPEFEANRSSYDKLLYDEVGIPRNVSLTPRNYQVTTIEPTGTVAQVAETSYSIEPNFSWVIRRQDRLGTRTIVHTRAAATLGLANGHLSPQATERTAERVLSRLNMLPDHFVTALDVSPREHIAVLAAAQRHVDNGVTKTCNGARHDTIDAVERLFRLAHRQRCKAVAYYRDGTREGQVLGLTSAELPPCNGGCE